MAKTLSILFSYTFLFFSTTLAASEKSNGFSRFMPPEKLGLRQEKLSHLHFYFHDRAHGPNPTAVRVASASVTNTSATSFGAVMMVDDPLTVAPEPDSKLVGKAQGIYGYAAKDEVGLLMVMNFGFVEGKYNGSYLSILGRNRVSSAMREMPIVGGTGVFRFARGYAQAKTHTNNFEHKSGDTHTVVEYNVYVFHY